jgi:indolepyruvate decarboxylase
MPPRLSVGAYLIDALAGRGVQHVFGVPGDFILGLSVIGEERGMRMVNCTREEAATYAADGYARENGLGAVAVTYGVGILATMAALGGANAEGVPVVVIGGAPGMAERDGRRIHHFPADDVDAPRRMMQEITAHSVLLDDPDEAFDQIDWLLHSCAGDMLPGYIELPRDLISAVPAGPLRSRARPAQAVTPQARVDAAADDVVAALNGARRPILWLGAGARRMDFGGRALAFAEATGIPIVESVMGKGAVDETHPLVLGVYVGAGSPPALRKRVESSDLVFEIGVDINDITTGAFTADIPVEKRINVYRHGTAVGHRFYEGVDLTSLGRAIEKRMRTLRRHDVPKRLPYSWATPVRGAERITTDVVADRLQSFVQPSDIVVSDVGVGAHLAMDARLNRSGQFHIARMYVGMGFAVPASYGAALARGKGRPIVLVGDGSFQMTGFDLSTAIREGVAPIVLVLDNHGYGAERSIADGTFNDIAQWDYAAVGAVVGAVGTAVNTPEQLDTALAAARRDRKTAHIIQVDLDKHDVPRGLKALGEGLAELMEPGD